MPARVLLSLWKDIEGQIRGSRQLGSPLEVLVLGLLEICKCQTWTSCTCNLQVLFDAKLASTLPQDVPTTSIPWVTMDFTPSSRAQIIFAYQSHGNSWESKWRDGHAGSLKPPVGWRQLTTNAIPSLTVHLLSAPFISKARQGTEGMWQVNTHWRRQCWKPVYKHQVINNLPVHFWNAWMTR